MKPLTNIRKILVITLSNLGDIVLTTPVISALRREFPDSEITVMAGPKGAELFSGCQTVDKVILYDKHSSFIRKIRQVASLFRARYDLVADLRHTAIPYLIFPRYRTPLRADRSVFPMRQRHLALLKNLISDVAGENRFDFFSERDAERAEQKFRRFLSGDQNLPRVIVAPGAGSGLKRWNVQKFSFLVQYLVQKNRSVILAGSEQERDAGRKITQAVARGTANLIGELNIREAAALIARADFVVSNDSALMHLAHELNRPVIGIFGPTDPQKYGPRGSRVRIVRKPLDCAPCESAVCKQDRRMCLDDLSVEEVIRACEELFQLETAPAS